MEKKSLINTLKSTKKPNVIPSPAKNQGATSRKAVTHKAGASRRYAKYN